MKDGCRGNVGYDKPTQKFFASIDGESFIDQASTMKKCVWCMKVMDCSKSKLFFNLTGLNEGEHWQIDNDRGKSFVEHLSHIPQK